MKEQSEKGQDSGPSDESWVRLGLRGSGGWLGSFFYVVIQNTQDYIAEKCHFFREPWITGLKGL